MGDLGDLLEAAHLAPRCTSLHFRGRRWTAPGAWRHAVESRLDRRRPGGLRGRAGPDQESPEEDSFAVWWLAAGRWRLESDGGPVAITSGAVTTVRPRSGGGAARVPIEQGPPFPVPFDAKAILRCVDASIIGTANPLGRPAWVLTGPVAPRAHTHLVSELWARQLPGDRFRFEIDRGTGLVVMAEALVDDDIVGWMRLEHLEVDTDIDETRFDTTGPDWRPFLSPQAASIRLVGDRSPHTPRLGGGGRHAVDPAERARDHPVTGPPPADEDAARAAIAAVFGQMNDVVAGTDDLVAVERGAGLAPCLGAARRLIDGDENGVFTVEHVRFVAPDRAAVIFTVTVGGRPLLADAAGEAVLVGDRWLVTRATFSGLMSRAGVTCPPAPDNGR